MTIKIGINGMGRIGKWLLGQFMKITKENNY